MSQFKTNKRCIIAILFLVAPLCGFAQEQDQLAPGVKALIFAEQHLLSRDVNERRIMTPKANFQEDKYKPENAQIFEMKSWAKKSSIKFFESAFISDRMKAIFERTEKGQEQVLMLVHPESESLFVHSDVLFVCRPRRTDASIGRDDQ